MLRYLQYHMLNDAISSSIWKEKLVPLLANDVQSGVISDVRLTNSGAAGFVFFLTYFMRYRKYMYTYRKQS